MNDLERIPPNEAEQIESVVKLTVEQMRRRYAEGRMLRGVHPKDHGCVSATFKVHDSLPAELQVGVFAKPGYAYEATIRYSNASVLVAPDALGSRGMAIKLKGVSGTPLLTTTEPETQDFLMVNHPVFAIANVEDYEALSQVLLENNDDPRGFFARIKKNPDGSPDFSDPATVRAATTFQIFNKIISPDCPPGYQPQPACPVDCRYFSGAPFAFGDGKAMKFSANPIGRTQGKPNLDDENYLRAALEACLTDAGGKDIVFDFLVQVRDAADLAERIDTDIENACFEWDEAKYPYVSVATITIPQQDINSEERRTFCENLRYSPWQGITEHRPLGGINRLRLGVYRESAMFRQQTTGDAALDQQPLNRE